MNRNLSLRDKAAQWAVWGAVLFFQANRASSSRAFGTDVPDHSAQRVRAGATSAADTLLWWPEPATQLTR